MNKYKYMFDKTNLYKTGVINDPLGQPTVPACMDFRLILTFWNGQTKVQPVS